MKKIFIITSLLIAAALFATACAQGQASLKQSAADSADKLKDSLSFQDTMTAVTSSMVEKLYGLSASDVKNEKVYVSTGATAEEIAVFEAADAQGASKIKDAVTQRIADLKSNFQNYIPSELQKLQNPVVVAKGNFVVFVVSADSAKAQSAADGLFQ